MSSSAFSAGTWLSKSASTAVSREVRVVASLSPAGEPSPGETSQRSERALFERFGANRGPIHRCGQSEGTQNEGRGHLSHLVPSMGSPRISAAGTRGSVFELAGLF